MDTSPSPCGEDVAKWKAAHPHPFPGIDLDTLTGKDRACVRAHLAFALLGCIVAVRAESLRAQGVPVVCLRGGTAIRVKLGLRVLILDFSLGEEAVRVTFASVSPYTGKEQAQLAAAWPPADLPQELLGEAAEALAGDGRRFLLHGVVPA